MDNELENIDDIENPLDKMSIKELCQEHARSIHIATEYPIYIELLSNKIVEKQREKTSSFIIEFAKKHNIDPEILKKLERELIHV